MALVELKCLKVGSLKVTVQHLGCSSASWGCSKEMPFDQWPGPALLALRPFEP